MEDIYNLVNLLDLLDLDDILEEDSSKFLEREDHELIRDITRLANDLLITEEGDCNWENIVVLRESGYNVYAVERDSFSWLLGGVKTRKGVIRYG